MNLKHVPVAPVKMIEMGMLAEQTSKKNVSAPWDVVALTLIDHKPWADATVMA